MLTTLTILVLFVAAMAGLVCRNKLIESRRRKLDDLADQLKRLEHVVSELLSRVDEIDSECRYRDRNLPARTASRLATTCSELVTLSEGLREIERDIHSGNLKIVQEQMLSSLKQAQHLSEEILVIRRDI